MKLNPALKLLGAKFFVSHENHPDFRHLLIRLSKNGMLFSGVIGIIATVSYIFANVMFDRRSLAWSYSTIETMVLWDKLIIIFISIAAILLSRLKLSLNFTRLIFSVMIFICAFAILIDDVLNQDISFSSGYLTILLLLSAICIPFKPWQILTICISALLLLYPGLQFLSMLVGVPELILPSSQIIYLLVISLIIVGSSMLLYDSRYAQYILRRSTDGLTDSAFYPENSQKQSQELDQARNLINKELRTNNHQWVSEIVVPSTEQVFLERVKEVIEQHIGDSNFGVEWLAHDVALSPRQLQRRLRASIGLSAGGLIRVMRLQRAAQLLERRAGNVSEIAYKVGFQDPIYFSRIFRHMFDVSPSKYIKSKRSKTGLTD